MLGKKREAMTTSFDGKEVHVNPSVNQRHARNSARMERIMLKMRELENKGDNESARYELLRREYTLRKLQKEMSILQEGV